MYSKIGCEITTAQSQPIDSPETSPPPHSPLSPLTPTSPLHPDGLIAPVWVRKHAELVPSVFVLFLRLFETPVDSTSDAAGAGAGPSGNTNKVKEREMDEALVREIGERRRRLGERGIKLTVVLMASAATLGISWSPSAIPC